MQQLTQSNLREQSKAAIRSSIIGGELVPGEVYSATTLSTSLGVSPTPVREALLDLANDGLVEPVRNRGFRILTIADADLDEISELRVMLEVPAMRMVIKKATDAEIEALEPAVASIEVAAERNDIPTFLRDDRAFHLALLALGGNARLVRLVGQLRDQTRLLGLRGLAESGRLNESAAEHRVILDAVRSRDVQAAESLMRRHLDHTRGVWAGRAEAP